MSRQQAETIELSEGNATTISAARAQLETLRSELKQLFFERDDVVDGLLSALLCKQHVLILGPPGTAKSLLASILSGAIDGAKFFYWLLTKFTTPEEVFGPISLVALQQDRVCRLTTGKMPEAHLFFADECFKANSAILNSFLTATNERLFHNDGKAVPIPLMTMIGASNELPESEELEAMFDRFLIRFWIPYLNDGGNVRKLLTSADPVVKTKITLAEIEQCQSEAMQVVVPDSVIDALMIVKQRTEEQGYRSSDRRWKQAVKLLKAFAYLTGDNAVNEDHLELLADVLWREPKDRPQLATVIGTVGNPLNVRATEIMDAAKELAAKLGSVNASDSAAKAEWLKQASLLETSLSQMEGEMQTLMAKNPNRNLRKVKLALDHVTKIKKGVTKRVAELYNL